MYQIYRVHEVRYANGSEPLELDYDLMTQVADSFPNAEDRFTYVIYRSTRAGDAEPWEALDTWSARKNSNGVIVSEGNTPFVKIAFPVRNGIKWNGNELNTLGEDEYEFKDPGQPREVNGMTFEKTATIEQERNDDVIVFRDERSEVYAYGVGLVYKEITQLQYCTDDSCLGQQTIEEGVEIKMEIKEYGND